MISLIWAMSETNLIGKDNKIPWHVKEDLLYYKEKTKGQTVLMGENTYDSLKGYYKTKPLPYGKIYVASLSERSFSDAIKVSDVTSFLKNNKEEKMYADVIDDYLYLGNGYYLIKCNDECAIVNMLGTFVEEFSDLIDFDSAQDDEGFYYDGLYVELDDVKTKSSYPGTIGYLIFESDVDSLTSTTIYRVI